MMLWVFSSVWTLVLASLVVSTLAVLLIAFASRMLSHKGLEANSGGTTVAVTGALFAFIFGLIVVNVWTSWSTAQDLLIAQGDRVADLYREVGIFPQAIADPIREDLGRFLENAERWDRQDALAGQRAESSWEPLFAVWKKLIEARALYKVPVQWQIQTYQMFNQILDTRRSWIALMERGLPEAVWITLVIAILTLLWTLARVGSQEFRGIVYRTFPLAFVTVTILFCTIILRYPFHGAAPLDYSWLQQTHDHLKLMYQKTFALSPEAPIDSNEEQMDKAQPPLFQGKNRETWDRSSP
jgi:hypothetical protein